MFINVHLHHHDQRGEGRRGDRTEARVGQEKVQAGNKAPAKGCWMVAAAEDVSAAAGGQVKVWWGRKGRCSKEILSL